MVALSTLLVCAALSATPDAVLLEFYSPSCGPCRSMQTTIDRLKMDGYPIQQVDVTASPDVARRFQITHVPTCVLVVSDKEVGRLDGVRTKVEIETLFKQVSAQNTANDDYIVRGQSPEPRRGLGLFNKLSGSKQPQQPAATQPSVEINTAGAAAGPTGGDPFAGRDNFATPAASSPPPSNPLPTQPAERFERAPATNTNNVAPAHSQPHDSGSAQQNALAATVRLKVQDPTGMSFGTGTIIDMLKDEVLIVTCGHIFRDSQGKGKISVDLYNSQTPVDGQLISFDLKRDIALVSIRPGTQVACAPVEGDPNRVVEGTRIFSVGCDHGKDPSVKEGKITAINKYTGSPNYTASGMPVEGRSGGGLFLADGTLIGICNAADPADQEGLYAGLGTVHWQLDLIGQTAIYKKQPARDNRAVAAASHNAPAEDTAPRRPANNRNPATAETNDGRFMFGTSVGDGMRPREQPSGKEIIFFVRDKNNPTARGEAVVIDSPSPELMDSLLRASRGGASMSHSAPQPTGLRTLPEQPPVVVRGQNR